jgi:hypothetical protein
VLVRICKKGWLLAAVYWMSLQGACSKSAGDDSCTVRNGQCPDVVGCWALTGGWFEPGGICATGESFVTCKTGSANLGGGCFKYIPTGKVLVVQNGGRIPTGNSDFPGEWEQCSGEELEAALNAPACDAADAALLDARP